MGSFGTLRYISSKLATPVKKLPGFIIVGAAKAGTTSMFSYLELHPDLFAPQRKEIDYFTKFYSRGLSWYKTYFNNIWDKRITFEASTSYMLYPFAAERIAAVMPKAKIIVMLRNPVDRLWSHYLYNKEDKKLETRSFEEVIANDIKAWDTEGLPKVYSEENRYSTYIRRSIYADQIQPYFDLFGKENVLVLKSEDMFTNVQGEVDKVFNFLGLSPFKLQDVSAKNKGSKKELIPMRDELEAFFKTHNERLYKLLDGRVMWPEQV